MVSNQSFTVTLRLGVAGRIKMQNPRYYRNGPLQIVYIKTHRMSNTSIYERL